MVNVTCHVEHDILELSMERSPRKGDIILLKIKHPLGTIDSALPNGNNLVRVTYVTWYRDKLPDGNKRDLILAERLGLFAPDEINGNISLTCNNCGAVTTLTRSDIVDATIVKMYRKKTEEDW